MAAIMLHVDDTLDEKKTHFGKSCSRENDFSLKVRGRRANDNEFPACVTVVRTFPL